MDYIKVPNFADDWSAICCPACGFDYLHHYKVETYFRDTEDSNNGLMVTAKSASKRYEEVSKPAEGSVNARAPMINNPSDRRDGIRIWLWCEGCEVRSALILIQHKGQTFMLWDDANKVESPT